MTVRDGALFVLGDGLDEIPGLFAGPCWGIGGVCCIGFEDVGFYDFSGGLFNYVFDGACRILVMIR